MPAVLDSTTSTPIEDIALVGIFSEDKVNMMTQTPGMVFFRIAAVSTPFMLGMAKSRRTTRLSIASLFDRFHAVNCFAADLDFRSVF
jgi:hypothetical protein